MTATTPPCRVSLVEIALTDELDMAEVPVVRTMLDDAVALRPGRLVLDMARCRLVDAAGISLLLEVHRRLGQAGARLTLAGPTPGVRRVLRITGVDRVLDTGPDRTGTPHGHVP